MDVDEVSEQCVVAERSSSVDRALDLGLKGC